MSDTEDRNLENIRTSEGSKLLLASTKEGYPRRFGLASELMNFLLVLFLGPVAVAGQYPSFEVRQAKQHARRTRYCALKA